ncbi:HlyD family efflux transporter periplasmic adaptor subunit [Desulforamulus hydrothermalis]|uniref:RND related barrel-sandwich hybrid domain-containing protein n=1 Tax=Desulforamulus hydrothermalis Lam5 = DSM 18033 TaxID=1121428 RepID=K8EJL3_9FIRM|nr:HlyD family efflux transporter periplasmic adaptor subunit [Desulforamulus hydrothermalis]CCO08761.1 conserved exported hypothetical protein [Desulforamulus hydrothermalis Lam5 = DSM 18033]SHG70830.1 putative membrane fusion protein [Desulforamulus hydrothermalis Lam5 = DSM 18033]
MVVKTEGSGIKHKAGRHRKVRVVNGNRFLCFVLICFIIAAMGWLFASSAKSFIYKQLITVDVLQPGVVEQDYAAEGILIKQEYLVKAPLKGNMKFLVADGERVKAGTSFGELAASDIDAVSGVKRYAVKAPVSGVVCRHVDGWETVLLPGNLDVVEIPALDKIKSDLPEETKSLVEHGQPVAKVIDNLAPIYVYALFSLNDVKQIQQQKDTVLKLKWAGQVVEARVDKVFLGEQPAVLFIVKNYPDEILHYRKIKFHITTAILKGILIDEKSLVQRDNRYGIYLAWKGFVRWLPVEVTGRLEGRVAIRGTDIQPGIRYVVNPAFAREGDKL